jgi:hypothetical protein
MEGFHGRRRPVEGRVEQCDAPVSAGAMPRNCQLPPCEHVQTNFMHVRKRDVSLKRRFGECFEKQL